MSKYISHKIMPDGTLMPQFHFLHEEKPPEPDRIPPPKRDRRDLADYVANTVLESVGVPQFRAFATGGKKVKCRHCGVKSHFSLKKCSNHVCGKPMPPQQFHSSVYWHEDGQWLVAIGRNCTQSKRMNKMVVELNLVPSNGLYKDDPMWITYCNTIAELSIPLWCHIRQVDPNSLHVGVMKSYGTHSLKMIIRKFIPAMSHLLEDFI